MCYTISNRVKMTWRVLQDAAASLIIVAGPLTKKIQQSPLISLIAKAYEKVHITSFWTYINPGISCSACMHADTRTQGGEYVCIFVVQIELPSHMRWSLIAFQKRDRHTYIYTYIQLPISGPQSAIQWLALMRLATIKYWINWRSMWGW